MPLHADRNFMQWQYDAKNRITGWSVGIREGVNCPALWYSEAIIVNDE